MKSSKSVAAFHHHRFAILAVSTLASVASVAALASVAQAAAFAETAPNRYAPAAAPDRAYQRAPSPSADEVQIVFLRGPGPRPSSRNSAAHVYVDGELEGALVHDSYTRFCVSAHRDTHTIEAYIGDAPIYAGKRNPHTRLKLEGGQTYFIGVSENGSGEPQPFSLVDAERLLANSREQRMIINRASAVVPCHYQSVADTRPALQFRVSAEVLFRFDKSDAASITGRGREELRKIAAQILALPPQAVARLTVTGHADPIGSASYNLALSERRARTVANVLTEYGIARELVSTAGRGSAEPLVDCPTRGKLAKRIACNAPNRRVEINVETAGTHDGT
jgi:OOP family OmpA-OmpF porin